MRAHLYDEGLVRVKDTHPLRGVADSALPSDFLDELRARIPLAPMVGRRTKLERAGRQWKACCPFHSEKTPSFYVWDDHYHCFGCGAHGDAIRFVMQSDGAGFMEAVERLAGEAGIAMPRTEVKSSRDGMLAEMSRRQQLYVQALASEAGRIGVEVLRRAGLSDQAIVGAGIGWCSVPRPGATTGERGAYSLTAPIRSKRGDVIAIARMSVDGETVGPSTIIHGAPSKARGMVYGIDVASDLRRGKNERPLMVARNIVEAIKVRQVAPEWPVVAVAGTTTPGTMWRIWDVDSSPIYMVGPRGEASALLVSMARHMSVDRLVSLVWRSDADKGGRDLRSPSDVLCLFARSMPFSDAVAQVVIGDVIDRGWGDTCQAIERFSVLIGDRGLGIEVRRELLKQAADYAPDTATWLRLPEQRPLLTEATLSL